MSEGGFSTILYKYIGLITIILFIIFIVVRTLNFQVKVLEGFTNETIAETDRNKIPEAITNSTTTIQDILQVNNYSNTYEDILINLENNINYNILGEITKQAEQLSKNPYDDSTQKIITSINNMRTFKDTLNDSMNFLNKISTDSSSGGNADDVKDMSSALSSKLKLTGINKGPSASLFSSFDD
jgi:hypothetical protein